MAKAKRSKKRGKKKNPTKYVVSRSKKGGGQRVRTSDGHMRTIRKRGKKKNPTKYVVSRSKKGGGQRVRTSDGHMRTIRKRKNGKPSGDTELRRAVASALRTAPKKLGMTASPNAAYFRLPKAARATAIRRLQRRGGRGKRQAAALARAEQRREGPRERRPNPPLSDAGARAEYERKHWGERGRGAVRARGAADPRYGTAVQLGKLVAVVYRTKKRGDGLSDYEHEFEGELPDLAFNDGGLLIAGGSYVIKDGGIDG